MKKFVDDEEDDDNWDMDDDDLDNMDFGKKKKEESSKKDDEPKKGSKANEIIDKKRKDLLVDQDNDIDLDAIGQFNKERVNICKDFWPNVFQITFTRTMLMWDIKRNKEKFSRTSIYYMYDVPQNYVNTGFKKYTQIDR